MTMNLTPTELNQQKLLMQVAIADLEIITLCEKGINYGLKNDNYIEKKQQSIKSYLKIIAQLSKNIL
jgi:hypothetical protein